MLLSWIKNISRQSIHTRYTLGLTFNRSTVSAVLVSQLKEASQLEWHDTIQLTTPFFDNEPNNTHLKILKAFLEKVNRHILDKFVRVQVFLPDPMALYGFYQFDSIPDNAAQCRQLAGWRIAKQFHVQDKLYTCDYQLLDKTAQNELMMAVAMDRQWLSFIQDGLVDNGILAPLIDTRVSHHFNQLEMSIKQAAGAAIDITEDYWTVMAWNSKGQPRLVRSSWRNREDKETSEELIEIAHEMIESLLVYCNETSETQVTGIYIYGNGHTEQVLANTLNQHLTQAIKHIELTQFEATAGKTTDTSSIKIRTYATAIPR